MTEYTPGPWRAEFDYTVQGLACWRIESDTVRTLAALTFASTREAMDFGRANASLIAAAPDMLAALRTCEAEFVTLRARLSGQYARNAQSCIDIIRAAMAKAAS